MPIFRNSPSIYKYSITDIVAKNLQSWLSYGFVEAGAYTNITYNSAMSGFTSLKLVNDDRFAYGQVYEMFGPGLVWETDVINNDGSSGSPLICSGIHYNGTFYASSGISPYSHTVDFNNGRVIFNTPLTSGSVSAEYCMRDIDVRQTDAIQWKTIISSYMEKYSQLDILAPSGMASILKDRRVWLPSVYIEAQDRTHKPLELGSFSEYATIMVMFHVFAAAPSTAKQILDTINDQVYSTIDLYDINLVPKVFNYNGSVASGALSQKVLSNRQGPYYWRSTFIADGHGKPISTDFDIFRGECTFKTQIERY